MEAITLATARSIAVIAFITFKNFFHFILITSYQSFLFPDDYIIALSCYIVKYKIAR